MRIVKQSTTPTICFLLVDSTDHVSGKSGLTVTARLSKNGGSSAATTNSVTEIDATNLPGWYKVTLTAAESDTIGDLIVRATATGADQTDRLLIVESATTTDLKSDTAAILDDTGTTGVLVSNGTGAGQVSLSGGKILLQATQTGVTIPTVTSVTNAVSLTGDLTATMKTSVTTAATAATPTTTLATSQPNYAPAKAGDAMALTSGERTTLTSAIWNALTSGLATAGSIGKLLVDNINATISSRSTYAGADTGGTTTLLSRLSQALTFTAGKVDANASLTLTQQNIADIAAGVVAQLPGQGTGNTAVNHNTGGADNLRYTTTGGAGIDNAQITAYLKSDWQAGNLTAVRGSATTGPDGRWTAPIYLDSGFTYVITFYKQDQYSLSSAEVSL